MNELHSILDAWPRATGGVLATVVEVKGSAYRRPGARMLLFPDGRRIGSISGGCLEGDVCRKAWWLTEEQATVRVYDTMSEDDAVWEFGLGCNGVVHVLLERVESDSAAEMMAMLAELRASGGEGVVATVIRGADGIRPGERLLLDAGGVRGGSLAGSAVSEPLVRLAEAALAGREHRHVEIGGCSIFVEWVGQPVPLVIFGAGHDAIPLVAIAKQMGWHVTVADGRPAYAKKERFPEADRVVLLPAEIKITEDSVVVFITHNYPFDESMLREVLPAKPRYIGLLGPRKRADRLFAELGMGMSDSVHAPVGLDIGADTPAAIALSIVAEIQAVLNARSGGRLRARQGPIHDTPGREEAVRLEYRPPRHCAA